MRVTAVELSRLELELVHPLRTSRAEHSARPLLIVAVVTEGATGIGECSALLAPTYTSEYADAAEAVLLDHLLPRLLAGGSFSTVGEAMARLAEVRGHLMAKAAVEMALLDADLRGDGHSLASFLGAQVGRIPAGANVSIGTSESVVADIGAAVGAGYRRVKVKIAPGHDGEVLCAARAAFPALTLAADANGSYDPAEPTHIAALRALDDLGLAYVEQPFQPAELTASAQLCRELETPVVLDESIASRADLDVAASLGALDGVSVKLARLGGLLAAREVHDRCCELGLSASIGGMLESGVGRAAAIALGALPGFDLPGDLGGSDRYFQPDLTAPHRLVDGELPVPSGPGLGVELDRGAFAAALVRTRRLT